MTTPPPLAHLLTLDADEVSLLNECMRRLLAGESLETLESEPALARVAAKLRTARGKRGEP